MREAPRAAAPRASSPAAAPNPATPTRGELGPEGREGGEGAREIARGLHPHEAVERSGARRRVGLRHHRPGGAAVQRRAAAGGRAQLRRGALVRDRRGRLGADLAPRQLRLDALERAGEGLGGAPCGERLARHEKRHRRETPELIPERDVEGEAGAGVLESGAGEGLGAEGGEGETVPVADEAARRRDARGDARERRVGPGRDHAVGREEGAESPVVAGVEARRFEGARRGPRRRVREKRRAAAPSADRAPRASRARRSEARGAPARSARMRSGSRRRGAPP